MQYNYIYMFYMSYIRHTLRSTYLYMFAFIYLCMCARGGKNNLKAA